MFWSRFCFLIAILGLPVMAGGALGYSILARGLPDAAGPTMLFVGLVLFFGGAHLERRITPKWFSEQSAI